MSPNNGEKSCLPLFETKLSKGRVAYKFFSFTILIGIVFIWIYRFIHIPKIGESGRYACIGMFTSEVLFGLYWIITQSSRWNVVYRYPFRDRLSERYEDKLPGVDIFVCTADPILEPPSLVINTVLSLMAYNYPPQKLTIYLSDDGGSELTFYALLEASKFAKYWIPFCKKYNVEPRSPQVYFAKNNDSLESSFVKEWNSIKKLYLDMKNRIELASERGSIPDDFKDQHKGFSEWNSNVTKQDHQSIVQILIDEWKTDSLDIEGNRLPTLVYLSREKRQGYPHNFKAGSMNALIRVSSEISNSPIILNVDCDMYSNDPNSIRDALCFFLDERKGKQISYVQYPQRYDNITKNDIYASAALVTHNIELAGLDGFGGTLYIGTGCFHRRQSLSGSKYCKDLIIEWNNVKYNTNGRTVVELEETSKALADCSYEKNTQWGKEMGLVYGCSVEDIATGLKIQCRGWKPVYYTPNKNAFQGVSPTTLDVSLVQFKRWSEGMFQIFFSKYCPFVYGHGKIEFGAQMGYCIYLLWAPVSLPTLIYVIIPAIGLIHDVPLFPKVSDLWFLPFAYVSIANTGYALVEDILCGNTLKGWWNYQRMWVIRRTTSYFFALIDTIKRQLGLSETSFVVTGKVVDDDVQKRYEKEMIEFGSSSIMFVIIGTLALMNLLGFGYGIKRVVFGGERELSEKFLAQITLCGLLVMANYPVYEAMFFRTDKGSMPASVVFKSVAITSIACLIPVY